MTDLNPTSEERRQVAPAQPAKPSRAMSTAKALEAVDTTYLVPFRAFERLGTKVRAPGDEEPTWPFIPTFYLRRPTGELRTAKAFAKEIETLEARLAERPGPEVVDDAYDAFVRLRGQINHAQNRTIVALMLDAFPNARAHSPEAWMESVVKEVRVSEFSTLVVAKACNLLTRSETFAPSVGVVIERCELVASFVDMAIAGVKVGRLQRQYYALCLEWLRKAKTWDGNPETRPKPISIDLGCDPFEIKKTGNSSGRVSWV
ncbi:hypothetical protein GCM10017620_24800 [Brevundimonas intermedia]|uniref:Uncharacterized protein n=1 Tax=Brevundimonas intermedia TaxID=74315 RepID=A0ABQ5T9M3_9CAUL|nr:hypothetical protein [Brevundimonas intermedia]GLK49507.1 hypothetical protein GCM10017620_24800 [Brevundimonas intermedia]